jgi:RimJ/RimL family protein N-acetyltransferase
MKKILETERLILREFTIQDAVFILRLLNTPGWLQFIGDRGVKTLAEAQSYLLNGPIKSYRANGFGLALVAVKETGMVIGMCGLIKREGLEDVDIGFALLSEYERKGYAYEAAFATLNHAKTDLGINRIVAIVVPENTSSINLLKKLGMQFEKTVKLPGSNEELFLFANVSEGINKVL